MRFLMICMKFPTGAGQSYLTTELADGLVGTGHQVEVLLLDWEAAPGGPTQTLTTDGGVRVVRCAPRVPPSLGGWARDAGKFVLSGLHAARVARRHFDLGSFDAAIAWMPAVAIAPLVGHLRRIPRRLLFIWDFFPDHHREIGRISGGPPYWIARAWEQRLMAAFNAVIVTLPGNADYLRRRYRLRPDQRVVVTPVWSETAPAPPIDRAAVRARHGLPSDAPIAVFGGQLVEGRGFEQMLGAAEAGLAAGSPLRFLFVGEGRLGEMVRREAFARANVAWRPPLPRSEYLELLAACDVGMVATVPGVTSFSIPSKTIDYLRAGLPVIAAVEHGSDFAAILDRYAVGRAVAFHDAAGFLREAERLAGRPAAPEAARRCLDEVFAVRHAVATVLDASLGRRGP